MSMIFGVDGCPAGWICISKNFQTGELESALHPNIQDLMGQLSPLDILAIDIPIGLSENGPRECDKIARRLLGSRACCVFSAPLRPVLHKSSRIIASQCSIAIDGHGVGCQAWNIFPKIREVDHYLKNNIHLQNQVFEVHPEVCFWAWNGAKLGTAMQQRKKSSAGSASRQKLIHLTFGEGAFAAVRIKYKRQKVQSDDIADAFAALWTAGRIFNQSAVTIPNVPPVDAIGLRMQMTY